jgi:hypothetical protein
MMECMPEVGHCQSICTLSSVAETIGGDCCGGGGGGGQGHPTVMLEELKKVIG